jgi:alkanesulfonate monooxygenase SsuD/methylene tetrahydromethanopterin reductase-like flavin-dependent oxidoreductase (luciferase family)
MTDFLLYAIICTGIAWLIVNRWKWKRAAKTAQRFNRIQAGVIRDKQSLIGSQDEVIDELERKVELFRGVANTYVAKQIMDEVETWPEEFELND